MKLKLLLLLLLLAIPSHGQVFQNGPEWDKYEDENKKHPKPPVPEPSTYGFVFMAIAISFVGYRIYKSK